MYQVHHLCYHIRPLHRRGNRGSGNRPQTGTHRRRDPRALGQVSFRRVPGEVGPPDEPSSPAVQGPARWHGGRMSACRAFSCPASPRLACPAFQGRMLGQSLWLLVGLFCCVQTPKALDQVSWPVTRTSPGRRVGEACHCLWPDRRGCGQHRGGWIRPRAPSRAPSPHTGSFTGQLTGSPGLTAVSSRRLSERLADLQPPAVRADAHPRV